MRAGADWKLDVLDLLVDGPSSFAGLYATVRRLGWFDAKQLGGRPAVGALWEALLELERGGLIKTTLLGTDGTSSEPTDFERRVSRERYEEWLPESSWRETAVDEVGLWFELQSRGREEWNARVASDARKDHRWTLDQDAATHTITVRAEKLATAEQVLAEWLRRVRTIEAVAESRTVRPCTAFELRDGTVVAKGAELQCRYREVSESE